MGQGGLVAQAICDLMGFICLSCEYFSCFNSLPLTHHSRFLIFFRVISFSTTNMCLTINVKTELIVLDNLRAVALC